MLQAIQKSSTPDVFVDVCKDIINSHEGKKFIEGLYQHTFITATFLKVLIQKTEVNLIFYIGSIFSTANKHMVFLLVLQRSYLWLELTELDTTRLLNAV